MRTVFRLFFSRVKFGMYLIDRCIPSSFFVALIIFFLTSLLAKAQTGSRSMSCYAEVRVGLSYTGEYRLSVNQLTGMADPDSVLVAELEGRVAPIIDCRDVGQKVKFIIRDSTNNSHCWGWLLVEDKLPFTLTCSNGIISCIEGVDAIRAADFVSVTDNCNSLTDLSIFTPIDSVGELYATPSDTLREIYRIWTVADRAGRVQQCQSILYELPLSLDSITIPPDTTIFCGQDPRDMNLTGHLNYTYDELRDHCHIAVDTNFRSLGTYSCGSKQKYLRAWTFSDWVSGVTRRDTQYIIVVDTVIATIIAPDTVRTLVQDCSPKIVLDPPLDIINNCTDASNADIYIKVDSMLGFAMVGDTIALGFGRHRLIYTGYNACIDYLIPDTLDFEIYPPTAPRLVCDSTLGRSISIRDQDSIVVLLDSAFASAMVSSCIPYKLLARKVNKVCSSDVDTFSSRLEFCIAEVAEHILIELIAEDSIGRRSDTCEVWIDVQERVSPRLELATDPRLLLNSNGMVRLDTSIIIASFGDNVGVREIRMTGSGLGMTGSGLGMSGSGIPLFVNGAFQNFTCADTGRYHVTVTVIDMSHNTSTKTDTLYVDGNGNCPSMRVPSTGSVMAYGSVGMEGVLISAEAPGQVHVVMDITDEYGGFSLEDLRSGVDYKVEALYDDEWSTGITANDMALMTDYLLGISDLDLYQQYTADVNGSGSINSIDVVDVRKILLGHSLNFDSTIDPWIFSHKMLEDSHEPLDQISAQELIHGGIGILAMKRGDMDADAMIDARSRSTHKVNILHSIQNEGVSTYRLNLGDPKNIKALQLMLDIDPEVQVIGVDAHSDLDVGLSDQHLDILYYQSLSVDPLWVQVSIQSNDAEEIFTTTNDGPKAALSWNHQGMPSTISLAYKKVHKSYGINDINMEVYPNPTTDLINVQLNVAGLTGDIEALLSIADAQGRNIYQLPVRLQPRGSFVSYKLPLPPVSGLYIASLTVGSEQRQVKIVKN